MELVRLVSNMCVLSNAVLAKTALPNVKIQVDRSCTASFDSQMNEKSLDVMQGLQVEIVGGTV